MVKSVSGGFPAIPAMGITDGICSNTQADEINEAEETPSGTTFPTDTPCEDDPCGCQLYRFDGICWEIGSGPASGKRR
ncbi:uncharacterized protein MONOS_11151 [Monocercomonoides exilis]|uniref:uncharacterized protein n=1 Tax=Monocercomonoides exilis TaxID=2049356 RepID=UPI00355A0067|nr:hypothetical protein MONOS_11151 [Monocercomonoides exilis]|eukprot:MONOS_11151.1-p1 / transcript=MONOS_11151.1 / gene=MONOS_11151 / organism=Monocercomonoides_exilis_PA203 / gene_product=unspecified product / transcript_product=unspecified product / location=Mono_scaffold00545:4252-4485(+) / protein_length=78 / sequence_SO=supercontig / SO=protein_coding / is_pseudo=false